MNQLESSSSTITKYIEEVLSNYTKMNYSVRMQLRLIYKHILISFLLLVVYISISFIIINELHCIFYLIPCILLSLLVNLILDAYSTNKIASFVYLFFIILLLYSNLITNRNEQSLNNLLSVDLMMIRTEDQDEPLFPSARFDSESHAKHYHDLISLRVKQNVNKYNIFFVETNLDRAYFSPRQLCAIESAALHNPNANIFILSIRAMINDTSILFRTYSNVMWQRLVPADLFIDTPLWKWWLQGRVFTSIFKTAHLSDAVRLALLWKYGGFYSDLDTITIKSYEPLLGYPGAGFLNGKAPSLANGFLQFSRHHPFLDLVMRTFASDYNPNIWGHNGPILLRRMMEKFCKVDNVYRDLILEPENLALINKTSLLEKALSLGKFNKKSNKCNVHVYPQEYFYPYNNYQLSYLFDKRALLNVSAFINTYSVHFYGKMSSKMNIRLKDNSVYEHFASSNCEITYRSILINNIETHSDSLTNKTSIFS